MMKIIVTDEQLNMLFTPEINNVIGYTDEILLKAGFENGICLKDCVIGDIVRTDDNRNIINPNLSNPSKLPRRVAFQDINEDQKQFWVQMVGEENIKELV